MKYKTKSFSRFLTVKRPIRRSLNRLVRLNRAGKKSKGPSQTTQIRKILTNGTKILSPKSPKQKVPRTQVNPPRILPRSKRGPTLTSKHILTLLWQKLWAPIKKKQLQEVCLCRGQMYRKNELDKSVWKRWKNDWKASKMIWSNRKSCDNWSHSTGN